MQAKSVLYAAVGAPVVVAKRVGEKAEALKGKVSEQTTSYGEVAEKTIDGWATEGEKVMTRISEKKVVEEISSKVDLDQAKEQVGKLRDQLEDMLATWRTSFRPEKAADKTEEESTSSKAADKPAAKKPATKASATKASATKASATKASAAKTTKSSTAKTSSKESTSAAADETA